MYLGDLTPADVPYGIGYAGYPTWLAWSRDVAAAGGIASTIPAQGGRYAGAQAAKYSAAVIASRKLGEPLVWTTGKQFGFYLAPVKILALDTLHQAQLQLAIAEGKTAEGAENIAKTVAGAAFGSVLVVALVAGGALYLSQRSHS